MNITKYKNKKIAVIGLGESGEKVIKFLTRNKAYVWGLDQKQKNEIPSYKKLVKLGINFSLGKAYLKNLNNFDLIVLSPGVPTTLTEIINARKNNIPICTEMKMFFDNCPAKIVGITGTNGKTTVTTLISKILKQGKKKIFLGGNIGQSLVDILPKIKKDDLVVLELSSFQLEDMSRSPHIAVILNITPDHLDRYPSFKFYVDAKKNILRYQNKNDYAVLNQNDKIVQKFDKLTKAKVLFFDKNGKKKNGAYIKNDKVYFGQTKLFELSGIKLMGEHNLENILVAVCVGMILKIPKKKIEKQIKSFNGVEHRLEFVESLNSIKFYNDSKATTPESTIAAISAFSKNDINLIAGGYDKHANFDNLGKLIAQKVKNLFLIGKTANQIRKSVLKFNNKIKIIMCKNLKEAVLRSYKNSESGDIILFSPACASFDMFKNYEERGLKFKNLVKKL